MTNTIKPHLTYLLGAGASRYGVPIVSELRSGMADLRDWLDNGNTVFNEQQYFDNLPDKSKAKYRAEFFQDLKWLIYSTDNQKSVDQLARTMEHRITYFNRDNESRAILLKIKALLSAYFTYVQLSTNQNRSVDNRYLPFYHLALKTTDTRPYCFPDDINIISWNYDMQIELAYKEIYNTSVEEAQEILGVIPRYGTIESHVTKDSANKYSVLKLNGTAGISMLNDKAISLFDTEFENNDQLVGKIIELYALTIERKARPLINFAWENSEMIDKIRKKAREIAEKTKILVVIGYSFHDYNREIDEDIINAMTKLERIYIVNEKTDIDLSFIKRIKPKVPISYKETDKFHYPDEYRSNIKIDNYLVV